MTNSDDNSRNSEERSSYQRNNSSDSGDDSYQPRRSGGSYAGRKDAEPRSKETPVNAQAASVYGARKPHSKDMKMTNPLEVEVNGGVEKAIKVLKRKLIKEGLFRELKSRRFYEKPSDKKKRKGKEALKKLRKEAARRQKNQMMF
jgi:small subunit ribosomal protein S21